MRTASRVHASSSSSLDTIAPNTSCRWTSIRLLLLALLLPPQVHCFQHGMRVVLRRWRHSVTTFRYSGAPNHLLTASSSSSSIPPLITPSTTHPLRSNSQPVACFATSFPELPPAMPESSTTRDEDGAPVNYTPYERWVRRLYMTNLFHPVKLGLQNIEQLHQALGNPMEDPQRTVIHVAGTNGKGSVVMKLARTLQLSNPNLKVGMFVSPHIASFRERMQVNGELISEDEVVELMPKIYDICEKEDIPATFFEITTALAFSFFAARQTDVVVLETGLGGRLDATNAVKSPAITIITSIGLEHTRILGDTIEQIAKEKAGIIKERKPVLVGPNVPHDVIRQCAKEKKASGYYTCDDVLGVPDARTMEELDDYDLENARMATAALGLLKKSHPHHVAPSDEAIRQGTSARPPCRFEPFVLDSGLTVILDVAHNPPAMQYLQKKLQSTYPDAAFRMVVGMSSDKDLGLCGESVRGITQDDTRRIHLVQAAHPRAATLEDILEKASLTDAHYDLNDRSVSKQIQPAMELASKNNEILVVCGSVFLMAEARESLGIDEPRDSAYIAEVAGAGSKHGQENFGNTGTTTLAK